MILVAVTGPSASGKTTFVNSLPKEVYREVPGYTSRPRRGNGDDTYTFISEEEFEDKDFCEVIEFRGHKYGRKWNDILEILQENKIPVVIVETDGIIRYTEISKLLRISLFKAWIGGMEEVLRERIISERPSEEVEKRINNLHEEIAHYKNHSWNFVCKQLNNANIAKVIENFVRTVPLIKKHSKIRFWS